MLRTISIIIPIYNENTTSILNILEQVHKLNRIQEVICIDDGSEINYEAKILKQYPKIIYIRHDINQGKSQAVLTGLKMVSADFTMLLDADLINLQANDLRKGLELVQKNFDLDGLIFKRINTSLLTRIQRTHLFLSGERIINTHDLRKAIKELQPKGFQLEVAINLFWMQHNKQVVWVPSSAISPHKMKKMGLVKGFWEDFKMDMSVIFGYGGLLTFLKQIFFFHPKNYSELHAEKEPVS